MMPALFQFCVPSMSSSVAHPRGLHSFPTRRSSDLELETLAPVAVLFTVPGCRYCDIAERGFVGAARELPRVRFRKESEEHTSELQSHHDLVCRLLLEKKNSVNQRLLFNKIIPDSQ